MTRGLQTALARLQGGWQSVVVLVPYFWLLLFFLVPFFIVLKISLAERIIASPPFSPLFQWAEDGALTMRLLFDNFVWLWEDELYVETYLNSLRISIVSTILCLLIGTRSPTASPAHAPRRGRSCC